MAVSDTTLLYLAIGLLFGLDYQLVMRRLDQTRFPLLTFTIATRSLILSFVFETLFLIGLYRWAF